MLPVGIQLFLAFVVGGLFGLLIGWLMARGRAQQTDSKLVEDRQFPL